MKLHRGAPVIRPFASWITLVTTVVLLAACGGSKSDTTTAPVFEGVEGAALFQRACASCHGADLNGTDQGPSFLHDFYVPGHHTDAAFLLAARRGVRAHHWNFGDMPPVDGVTDEQIVAIVDFVREQQRAVGIQ